MFLPSAPRPAASAAMAVGLAATVGMRAVSRQVDHPAMTDTAFGDDAVGKLLHVGAAPLQYGDLHAAVVIDMHVQSRLSEIVAVMKVARQPLRQIARFVLVDVDQCGKAQLWSADLGGGLLQTGASKVTDRLGAVGIAASGHEAIELRGKVVVDGDRNALHGRPH